MPVYLRRFYFQKLKNQKDEEIKSVQKSSQNQQNPTRPNTYYPPQSSTNPRIKR